LTLPALAAASGAALLAACGGGGASPEANGTLRVALTDAPCHDRFSAVHVTVEKVRVHRNAGAAEGESGWSEIVLAQPRRIELLALNNGVLETLGETALPAGSYGQMRLVLAANSAAQPMANAVTPTGGTEVALDTPSGQQSGLKMNVNLTVEPGQLADMVIDFDVCKSVVTRGQSGRFNLKPVLSATAVLSDAGQRVVGYVAPALASPGTLVSVQLNGQPVKASPPDPTGKFVLYPVPTGTYDLVVTANGRVNAVMTGVPVISTGITTTNPSTAPIDPPVSAVIRQVSGTAQIAGSSTVPDATVQLMQSFSGTPIVTFEVAAQPVDAGDGSFRFTAPAGAPVRAAYAAGATTLNFAPDAAAAGLYTLVGKAPGRTTQTVAVDALAGDVSKTVVFP
jgi:hypothetical protein